MRLWTFQHKGCINTLLKGKEWFSDLGAIMRLKQDDRQYSYTNSDGMKCAPVYCFAKVMEC